MIVHVRFVGTQGGHARTEAVRPCGKSVSFAERNFLQVGVLKMESDSPTRMRGSAIKCAQDVRRKTAEKSAFR